MNYQVVQFNKDENYIEKFIMLPRMLYKSNEITQNQKEEHALLTNSHLLSKYFKTQGFLVLDGYGNPAARALVTIYPEAEAAYLGFFECIDDSGVSSLLFSATEEYVRSLGIEKITGPVDCSFWIKYRLKINNFDIPYTGEPYNKPYYKELFLKSGYQIIENYRSNYFRVVDKCYENDKFSLRLQKKLEEGYKIISPKPKEFHRCIQEIYRLLIDLYSDFPVYQYIEENEFMELFSYLRSVLRYEMVKLAYYNEKAIGFFISIPNYNNFVYGKPSLLKLCRIIHIRRRPQEYVMLYMGIDNAHHGMGKAMAESIKDELKENGLPSIGALIRQGKVNGDYFADLITKENQYILLEKRIV